MLILEEIKKKEEERKKVSQSQAATEVGGEDGSGSMCAKNALQLLSWIKAEE